MNKKELKNRVSQYVLGLTLEASKSGGYRDADYICAKSNEVITIILDQAIIMVEDEMYEDSPSFDSLQRKLIDLKGGIDCIDKPKLCGMEDEND